ncbi:MAG: bile acid:sodium symporter family protein, partial [Pirellulales bacterium]|nr:bile acid:sodium symporter family protein [Pirellulales bacterium]
FGLEGPWMIGIVMVGCVPGAMASNVLTMMARGNVSYSVSLTTSATILSPLVVPWILWLALGRMVENFPVGDVFFQLCWMVVGPVVIGYILSRIWSLWAAAARLAGAIIANLTILWIIAVVVGANRDGVSELDCRLIFALLAVNLAGYAAGYFGGQLLRLPEPMRRALTLEIGMQNAGLGTTLAMTLFADERIALPAALYTFGCMFTGTVLARVWAVWSERKEK